jgi:hypothetical protein
MPETALPIHATLLHPVTGQSLMAIGHRRNGEPIWPVIGGRQTEEELEAARQAEQEAAAAEGEDEELGEKGQKALAAEKERRKAALRAKRDAEARAAELQAEIERLKAGTPAEGDAEAQKRARQAEIDAAIKQATDAANTAADRRVLRADVLAAAAGKLRHPTDALAFGDLDSIELQADGTASQSDIDDLITDVLTKRPDLAATATQRIPSAAEVDAGPQGETAAETKPRQVTEAELKTMSEDQIVQAQLDGRLQDLLTGKGR